MFGQSFKIPARKLRILHEIIPALISESNLDRLLHTILDKATDVMEAERASLFLWDKQTNELWTRVTSGADITEIRIPADKGIAGAVITGKAVINIKDAYQDERFETSIDQQTGYRTRAILAVPIFGSSSNLIGVIEVLNKKGRGLFSKHGIFRSSDISLMEAFTTLVGITLQNSIYLESLIKSVDNLSRYTRTLEKYTHQQILEMLQDKQDPTAAAPLVEKRAILFCDIRGYTSRSKGMPPDELAAMLNRFFGAGQKGILQFNGKIEKLIGDSIMASFQSPDHALNAAMKVEELVKTEAGLDCGIGLAWGGVLIGNVGGEGKLDYTLVGDPVNLASRLEKLNKAASVNTSINFSEDFYIELSDALKQKSQANGLFKIRGLDNPVRVYGL